MNFSTAGIFNPIIAYKLLNSCAFGSVVKDQIQIKLLKDISLSENVKDKISQQVKRVYGDKVEQLQIIPLAIIKKETNSNTNKKSFLAKFAKQLYPISVWYKAREFLIAQYSIYAVIGTFSKLLVVEVDIANKKIILKSMSAFYNYFVRTRHMHDLETAFQVVT